MGADAAVQGAEGDGVWCHFRLCVLITNAYRIGTGLTKVGRKQSKRTTGQLHLTVTTVRPFGS